MPETPPSTTCACEPVRERLRRAGGRALADAESLAVLLAGDREPDVRAAERLLTEIGGLTALATETFLPLPPPLAALRELAVRLSRAEAVYWPCFDRPAATAGYLQLRYARPAQEVFGVIYVDAKNHAIAERELFRGTCYRLAVEIPLILREGLVLGAAGMILFHTHPSTDAAPSTEDLEFTRRVADACALLELRLVDHFILGTPVSWVSLAHRGVW